MSFNPALDRAYEAVTELDVIDGGRLYPMYHERIAREADRYGFPLAAACGAFAALSPSLPINSNFRAVVTCMHYIREGVPPRDIPVGSAFKRGSRAAITILSGRRDFSDICSGPKITAFRDNLLRLHDSDRATIDGHMISIMLGRDLTMKQAQFALRGHARGGPDANYVRFERAFKRWCRRRGGHPATLQAILWHSRRRQKAGGLPLGMDVPERIEPYPLVENPLA
jgi:hypothetical protein